MITKTMLLLRHQTQIARMSMLVMAAQFGAKMATASTMPSLTQMQTVLAARQAILAHEQYDYGVAKTS